MEFAILLTLKAWSCIHFNSDRFGWVWLSAALIFCWGYFVKFEYLSFSQSDGRCGLCLNKRFSSSVCSSFTAVFRWRFRQLGTLNVESTSWEQASSKTQQSLHSVTLSEKSGRKGLTVFLCTLYVILKWTLPFSPCRNIICNGQSQHSKFSEKRRRAWLSQSLKQRAMSTTTIVCTKESSSNQSSSFTSNVS